MKYGILVCFLLGLATTPAFACKKPEAKAAPNATGLGPAPGPPGKGGGDGRGAAAGGGEPQMDAVSQAYAACVAKQCTSGSTVCQQQCVRGPDDPSWEDLPEATTSDTVVFDESKR